MPAWIHGLSNDYSCRIGWKRKNYSRNAVQASAEKRNSDCSPTVATVSAVAVIWPAPCAGAAAVATGTTMVFTAGPT